MSTQMLPTTIRLIKAAHWLRWCHDCSHRQVEEFLSLSGGDDGVLASSSDRGNSTTRTETKAHKSWIESIPSFDISICVHEDWEAKGFYLYELNPEKINPNCWVAEFFFEDLGFLGFDFLREVTTEPLS